MADGAKVVSLTGEALVAPGEVRPKVVGLAEKILERALAGDLQGLAVVMYHADETFSYVKEGDHRFGMIGALEHLKHEMIGSDH